MKENEPDELLPEAFNLRISNDDADEARVDDVSNQSNTSNVEQPPQHLDNEDDDGRPVRKRNPPDRYGEPVCEYASIAIEEPTTYMKPSKGSSMIL